MSLGMRGKAWRPLRNSQQSNGRCDVQSNIHRYRQSHAQAAIGLPRPISHRLRDIPNWPQAHLQQLGGCTHEHTHAIGSTNT